jgi:hypothetical protein
MEKSKTKDFGVCRGSRYREGQVYLRVVDDLAKVEFDIFNVNVFPSDGISDSASVLLSGLLLILMILNLVSLFVVFEFIVNGSIALLFLGVKLGHKLLNIGDLIAPTVGLPRLVMVALSVHDDGCPASGVDYIEILG